MKRRSQVGVSVLFAILVFCGAGCPGGGSGGNTGIDAAVTGDLAASGGGDMTTVVADGGGVDLARAADGGSCSFGPTTIDATCSACIKSHCEPDMSNCYGPGWPMNQFGGTCKGYTDCACKCQSDSCKFQCLMGASMACQSCATSTGNCFQKYCSSPCKL